MTLSSESKFSIWDKFFSFLKSIDWILFSSVVLLSGFGLVTMNSFVGISSFYEKQIVWVIVSIVIFFFFSLFDFRFLRRTGVVFGLFTFFCGVLVLLFLLGSVVKGSQSWFKLGIFSFQPSDPVKLVLIILLAKYFALRHIEIAHIRHILVSGFYAFIFFILVFLQPDFGSAIIIFLIWLGMVLVSGISKKHLFLVFSIGVVSFFILWGFIFQDYQKQRIKNFIYPLTDIRGSGYNAYQSTVAVGSGQILGKGIGYGTQSKLQFLPEYETDFIFAAFAEEWGFLGVFLMLILFGLVFWRILANSIHGASNFEILFGVGLSIMFMSQLTIHIGMNIGLLPVTGLTLPFVSYGGSHLITEFAGLGILVGMKKYGSTTHKSNIGNEIVGVE